MNEIPITTVKETRDEAGALTGWVVDGNLHVPDAPGNRYANAVQQWIADGNVPEPFRTEAEQAAARSVKIKQLAHSKIMAIAPEWKQRNLTARSVELLKEGVTSGAEVDAIQAVWDQVKAIRNHSDTLENNTALDINAGWPE